MEDENRTIDNCRVCGVTDIAYLCDTYNEHSKTTSISNYICSTCGSVFVGNNVDSEELGVAYSTLDSKKYYEEIESENTKKMHVIIANLKKLVPLNKSIIDIGTGNGLFVQLLMNENYNNVSAHEIPGSDLSKISDITNNIYLDYDYSTIPSDKFDAVTLLDVVEHVLDPQYLMKMCSRI